ncbi:hypothetical protein BG006_002550 [Podila minutissima]|uniref:Uncharacterized protein n=1 Tax=Podila minutissima TaxID=64525 RepID=A0A9P5SSA0_9FUNG|nr:hypothetical protein BG006_002550 [Podila minutissima]
MRASNGHSSMDSMKTPPPSPALQELAELLDIIDSANRPSTSSTAADALVKFMKHNKARADIELSPRNLAIALKRSFLSMEATAVIYDLSSTEKRLNSGYHICSLALTCVHHIANLQEEDINRMLQEPLFIALASVVFDTSAFKHKDRQKSQAHKEWICKILELARTFVTMVVSQVAGRNQPEAIDTTIRVCNMLCKFAEDTRADYRCLNLNFSAITKLIPFCKSGSSVQLNFSAIISLLCRGVHKAIDTAMEATAQNTGPMPVKTALALTRFYAAQLPTVLKLLGSELAREDEESVECMNMVKITLSSLRSRVLSNRVLHKNHRTVLHDTTKTICNMEEQIVSALIGCTEITDDERYCLLCRLTSASGSRSVLGTLPPLSDKEWNLGRLYIALSILATVDEFSPSLQLQVYPVENTPDPSLLLTLLKSIKALGFPEFAPAFDSDADSEDDDTYLTVLSSLCLFAHLVQPRQFVKLQIDMTGLVLGHSELESSLGRDWWVCMSKELGQEFTVRQVITLMELLESFPVGQTSRTLASLMGNLIRNLSAASQAQIVLHIGLKLKEDSPTLLACFPFHCLTTQTLDELVIHCSEQWGIACDLMAADRLVVDAFYSSYGYIACIYATMSSHSQHSEAIEALKPKMLDWSCAQICGTPELLALVLNNRTDTNKVLYTVTHILSFLAVLQPLSTNDIIQVLDACVRLYDYQGDVPIELFILNFLESCSAIQATESEVLANLTTVVDSVYRILMANTRCAFAHAPLMQLVKAWVNTLMPDLVLRHVPKSMQQKSRIYREIENGKRINVRDPEHLWQAMDSRLKLLQLQQQQHHHQNASSTIRDVQRAAGTTVSPDECLAAIATAKRKLQVLFDDNKDPYALSTASPALKSVVAAEVLHLQRFVEDGSRGSTAMV